MRLILVSISKTKAEYAEAKNIVGNITKELQDADVLHIQKFINSKKVSSSQIQDIVASIRTKLKPSLYTQIGLIDQNSSFAEEFDAIERGINSNGCIGTSLKPMRFKASISDPNKHAISTDLFIATMYNTIKVLKPAATESQMETYKAWIHVSDLIRNLALKVGLRSSISLVLFDKANFPNDHNYHRLQHFPAANVINVGRRLASRNCEMPDNWLDDAIAQVNQTTAQNGQVVLYLPRGIPQAFDARNFILLADRLHTEGFRMHISTAQEPFARFLKYIIGDKPGVKVEHVVADSDKEAAAINARDIKSLHWSHPSQNTYGENSILHYIQLTLFILLLSKLIILTLRRLTHNAPQPKLKL